MDADHTDTQTVIRTLVLSDLVDSTKITARLGDAAAAVLWAEHNRIVRELIQANKGEEIDQSDGFLVFFDRPIDAVRYAFGLHAAMAALSLERGIGVAVRIGVHLGEVVLSPAIKAQCKAEYGGLSIPTAARIMSLGMAGQILMSRAAFDLARRASVGAFVCGESIRWLAHGPYMFKGFDEPMDIFEVGRTGEAPLVPPADSEKARRAVAPGDEVVLGWRPAPGQELQLRANWMLTDKLGEGGFGEVWLGIHKKTHEKRVFKFCFRADRLRALKREVTLFRLLKEALGDREDIARVIDWQFDEAPFFIESEFTEGGNFLDWAESQGGIGAVPLDVRLDIVAQVAEAVAAAHSVGVLHKDIKPSNILIHTDLEGRIRIRLTDFGIGLLLDHKILEEKGITDTGLTQTALHDPSSSRTGTRLYMAPELLEGKPPTTLSDVYALGVMLYQLISGDFTRALGVGWERDITDKLLSEDITACTDRDPRQRLASARQLVEQLLTLGQRQREREQDEKAREDALSAQKALEKAQRRRKFATLIAIAFSVFTLVVGLLGLKAERLRQVAEKQEIKLRRSLEQTQKAYTGAQELIASLNYDVRDALEPLGITQVLEGITAKTLRFYDSTPEQFLTTNSLILWGVVLNNMGHFQKNLGNADKAISYFKHALDVHKKVADAFPQESRLQNYLAVHHLGIGNALREKHEWANALHEYDVCETITLCLATTPSADHRWVPSLAGVYHNRGLIYKERGAPGDRAKAMEAFRKALRIRLQKEQGQVIDPASRYELSLHYSEIAMFLEEDGNTTESLENFRAALDTLNQLSNYFPQNAKWSSQRDRYSAKVQTLEGSLGLSSGKSDKEISSTGVSFRRISYKEACRIAQQEGKIVLIDFYTTWCGPCKRLDRETWSDSAVGQWVSEAAIPIKIDAEEDTALSGHFDIDSYPTIVFCRPNGSEIGRIVGFVTSKGFIDQAKDKFVRKDANESVQDLIDRLNNKSYGHEARAEAARLLGQRGDEATSATASLQMAIQDQYWAVRTEAGKALLKISPDSAKSTIPRLLTLLRSPDEENREAGCCGLGVIGAYVPEVVPSVVAIMNDTTMPMENRVKAVWALRDMNAIASISALRECFKDASSQIRAEAAWAAAMIASRGGSDVQIKEVVSGLIKLMNDTNSDVRHYAAFSCSLLGIKAKDAIPSLLHLLGDTEPNVRARAAISLGRIRDSREEVVLPLCRLLSDRDLRVRHMAVIALGNLGPGAARSAVPLIKEMKLKEKEKNILEAIDRSLRLLATKHE